MSISSRISNETHSAFASLGVVGLHSAQRMTIGPSGRAAAPSTVAVSPGAHLPLAPPFRVVRLGCVDTDEAHGARPQVRGQHHGIAVDHLRQRHRPEQRPDRLELAGGETREQENEADGSTKHVASYAGPSVR